MEYIIQTWMKSKKPQLIAANQTIGKGYAKLTRLMFANFNTGYHVLEVLHTNSRIVGVPLDIDATLRIETKESEVMNLYDEVPVYVQLDSLVKIYKSRRVFDRHRISNITEEHLDNYSRQLLQGTIDHVINVSTENFKTINVQLNDTGYLIYYVYKGRYYNPIELTFWGKQIMKRRYFEESSDDFEEYVNKLCEPLGGVVYYD